jgi:8-oxo-dGTP pyrophosphatase MutT (NUDIX family)
VRGPERIETRTEYEGKLATVRVERFRYPDGSTAEREVVAHPGAVAVLAHDERRLYLVRQPREAVAEPALLELPAGKLDVEGESPLETAKRELAEEVGKAASSWRELKRIYTSPGFADEEVWIYLATELSDVEHEPDRAERIEIVAWPLDELDAAIAECQDSKSLVGLLMFAELRRRGEA